MKYIYLIMFFFMHQIHPVIVRRIVNMSRYSPVHITSIHKKYVEFFHEIKPQSSLMMHVQIPNNNKVPRVFDGELSYVPALEKCNWLISILFGSTIYYICQASLTLPGNYNPTTGIWIARDCGYKLLLEVNQSHDTASYELIISDHDGIRLSRFMF